MLLLSHYLEANTPTYGNRDKLTIKEVSKIKDGSSANSSDWHFSTNHFGTHIDAPLHFFENGKTITDFPVKFWFSRKCFLLDIPCERGVLIDYSNIFETIPQDTEVLLLRTGYENYRKEDKYWNDNPGLSSSLGEWLKRNILDLKIIGFDFISLTSWNFREEGKTAHREFLGESVERGPICIVEDMALSKVKGSIENIFISPLFVKGANGSPVTVFANLKF